MSHFTTPLGQQLANPGTGEPFSTAVVNGDLIILENGIIADRARLTTIEGWGAGRPGVSGGAIWEVTSLATLDALSLAKVGDLAYMTDPGNGNAGSATIDALKWEAIAGSGVTLDWRVADTVVADTKAHLDSFIAAVAAFAGPDLNFRVGNRALVSSTRQSYIFRSTVGAYLIDATPLRMFPAGSAGVAVDPQSGIVTSSAQATLGIGTVATPVFVDPFTDYNVFFDVTGNGAATALQLQMLDAAGAPIATTLNDVYRLTINNSTVTSVPLMASATIPISGGLGGANFVHKGRFSIWGARTAAPKRFETHEVFTALPGVAATGGQVNMDGVVNSNALLTGFQFVAAAGAYVINEVYVEAVPR